MDPETRNKGLIRSCESFCSFLKYLKPWEVVGASDASLQVECLARNFLGREFAGIWHPASGLRVGFNCTLLLERLEVLNFRGLSWILDPLNDLSHGHKVHIFVVLEHLVHPEEESFEEFGVVLEPCGVEVYCKINKINFRLTQLK